MVTNLGDLFFSHPTWSNPFIQNTWAGSLNSPCSYSTYPTLKIQCNSHEKPIIQSESQADNPLGNGIAKIIWREGICQQHWHQAVGGAGLIMESQSQNSLGWERPERTFSTKDIFHTWCGADAPGCAGVIPWGNCLAGISCRGSPRQGRRIWDVFEHRVSSGAAAGKQSQGCCSSQCPTVVAELTVLGKPLHRDFHPLMGIVPRKSFTNGKLTVCLLVRSGFSVCVQICGWSWWKMIRLCKEGSEDSEEKQKRIEGPTLLFRRAANLQLELIKPALTWNHHSNKSLLFKGHFQGLSVKKENSNPRTLMGFICVWRVLLTCFSSPLTSFFPP